MSDRPPLPIVQAAALLAAMALATPAAAQTDPAPADAPANSGPDPMMAMAELMRHGALAVYPMGRDASGTAWQPDSEEHSGLHRHFGPWMVMAHGFATAIHDDQGGPRGGALDFVASHVMVMARRQLGADTLSLHAGFSADPVMGPSGYPLLLQTGESANGQTALVDRQHPHNLFAELSATLSHPLGATTSIFGYVGYPGEPALGPVTYLHRFAGMANPETPITHHWLDSTHVTFGVVTIGLVAQPGGLPIKLELSNFTGREPNQYRWGFNQPRMDSWSGRVTINPAREWSAEVSYGAIHSPEQLAPATNQRRATASVTWSHPLPGGNWETTLAVGQDLDQPGHRLNAVLAESALGLGRNTLFGRVENVDKDDIGRPGDAFDGAVVNVTKATLGYARTVPAANHLAVDLGVLASRYAWPAALNASYGQRPTSFMVFARLKLD